MPYLVLDPSTAEAAPAVTVAAPLTSVGSTLSEMETELALELGRRGDLTATDYKTWINGAYRHLAAMLPHKELFGSYGFTTVINQPFYEVPIQVAWCRDIMLIDDTNFQAGGRKMEQIDEQGYRALANLSDEPTRWFRFRRMFVLWGTPDAAYDLAVDCRIRPDDLVDPTDSPILPPEFHEIILLFARQRAFRALRMYNEASVALNDALAQLRPLLNTDAEELANANSVMQPITSKSQLYLGGY